MTNTIVECLPETKESKILGLQCRYLHPDQLDFMFNGIDVTQSDDLLLLQVNDLRLKKTNCLNKK